MSSKRPQGAAIPRYLGNIVGDGADAHMGNNAGVAPPSLKRPRRIGATTNAPRPQPPIGITTAEARALPDGVTGNASPTTYGQPESALQNVFTRLCVHLVIWDFARDFGLRDSISGTAIKASAARPLPLVYSTIEEYTGHWELALVEEIKANIVSNVAAGPFLDTIPVDASCTDSNSPAPKSSRALLDVDLTTVSCKGILGSEIAPERQPADSARGAEPGGSLAAGRGGGARLSDVVSMDFVLLSLEPVTLSAINSGTLRRGAIPGVVSAVEGRGKNTVVSVQVARSRWQEISASVSFSSTASSPRTNSLTLYVTALAGLVSQWREFMSLAQLRTVPLCKYILWGGDPVHLLAPSPMSNLPPPHPLRHPNFRNRSAASSSPSAEEENFIAVRKELSPTFLQWLESNFNRSQVSAILGAASAVERVMKDVRPVSVSARAGARRHPGSSVATDIAGPVDPHSPFTLIQGPPGTGKTATLLGLLNLLHHKEYLVYFDTIISKILSDDGISCRNRHLRSHITTDAPSLCTLGSESAVDVTKSPFVAFAIGLAKLKPRILVTAPSNIAIDNIIQRIMTKGFRDGNGVVYYPNILRIGAGYTNSSIQAVTLEGSVEKMFSCSDKTLRETLEKTKCGLVDKLRELFHLQTLLLNLRMAFNSFTSAPTIGEQDPASIPLPPGWELRVAFDTAEPYWVNHIKKTTQPNPPHREEDIAIKTSTMSADVWPVYSTFESLPEFTIYASRLVNLVEALETSFLACKRISLFLNRREISSSSSPHDFLNSVSSPKQIIEGSILDEAHIVLTTLNGSGHPSMEKAAPFPVLVVDEAGQCTEPSVLIPMRRGCKHCILVGDPMQLPATTFSPLSKSIKYDRSLLERLMRIGCEYHLLDVQYRMNPRILTFPNIEFYEGRVQNGDNVKIPSFQPSYIAANGLDPFMFFDLQSSYEVRCSTSKSRKNIEEAYFALELIEYLASIVPRPSEEHRPRVSIGVISPYLEQVQALQRLLAHHDTLCQDKAYLDVEVNTVDGFQGREMDFIIFSCVRSNSSSGIGFLSDIRRLNVALTRARFCLMLIGHGYTLSQHNETWSRLIEHAFRTNAMVHVTNSSGSMSQMLGARLQQGRNDDCYYPPIGMESDNNYRSRDESVADLSTSALNVLIREEIVSDSYFDAIEEGEIVD